MTDYLRRQFLADARVLDAKLGYISVSSFNLRMKPQVLSAAAKLIAAHFRSSKIDVIHGIPHSGNYLATAVALEMGGKVRLHTSRKAQHVPASWREVFRQEIGSFAPAADGLTVYSSINLSFVRKGERVLLVDDTCATGHTAATLIAGLKRRGIAVAGFAVMFDKMFQGGLDAVARLGIPVFSCLRVKAVTPLGQILLH